MSSKPTDTTSSTKTEEKKDEGRMIKAMACHKKNEALKEWSYKARELGEDDVEIKISHCGICFSDLHTIDEGWGPCFFPSVVGHEIVGTISAKGSNVKDFSVGDRVGVGAQCGSCHSCKACKSKNEQLCADRLFTYNSAYIDGEITRGGYAEAVRLEQQFVFHIPKDLPSEYVGPLMCAGATVYSPLADHGKKGAKCLVIGVGGLGHLAIQFAAKMGMEVGVLSHSANKKDECLKLGATEFIKDDDKKALSKNYQAWDLLIVTQNFNLNIDALVNLTAIKGKIVLLAAPEESVKFNVFSLFSNECSIVGSLIASPTKINDMLALAAKEKIRPIIELFKMSKVNDAIEKVRKGTIRYRAVLEADFKTE